MTDCGCETAKAELEEYLHNELTNVDAGDIAEHLAGCGDCESEYHVGVVLTQAVQRACKETTPDDVRVQVLMKLRESQAAQ